MKNKIRLGIWAGAVGIVGAAVLFSGSVGSAGTAIAQASNFPTFRGSATSTPAISIGANGGFLARAMTVTSVASGSFQGTVWGIGYTVDWSGALSPATSTANPTGQLSVGNLVSVSGRVASSSPFVVNATFVRDGSIVFAHPGKGAQSSSSRFGNFFHGLEGWFKGKGK